MTIAVELSATEREKGTGIKVIEASTLPNQLPQHCAEEMSAWARLRKCARVRTAVASCWLHKAREPLVSYLGQLGRDGQLDEQAQERIKNIASWRCEDLEQTI